MLRNKRSIIWKMPLNEFQEVVKASDSIGKVLRSFNLENKGRNNETLKRRCIEQNVDISHWKLGRGSNKGRKFNKEKIPLENILVENSTFSRTHLKKRLIKEKILEYKCRDCGNEGWWNNKPLSLQLEHSNGVSNDARISNLCFLCPSCHSQTDTYAGKARKVIVDKV